jgi:hypothetical protein
MADNKTLYAAGSTLDGGYTGQLKTDSKTLYAGSGGTEVRDSGDSHRLKQMNRRNGS